MLFCGTAYAQTETLNWYMDGNVYATTQCESGNDILLPTTPTKRGYTFKGWAEYQPIEYLESTGTQYIDTGLKTNGSDRFVSYWYSIIDTGNYTLYGGSNGSIDSGERAIFWNKGNRIEVATPTSPSSGTVSPTFYNIWYTDRDYVIDDNLSYIKINDTIANRNVSAAFQSKYNFQIFDFTRNGYSRLVPSTVRLKQFQWYRNDTLIRDFVPALDSAGTPCMFDKVEHKFYYNAGTGQFIAGPIIGAE